MTLRLGMDFSYAADLGLALSLKRLIVSLVAYLGLQAYQSLGLREAYLYHNYRQAYLYHNY